MNYKIGDNLYNVVIIKKNNKNTYIRIDDNLNIVITTKITKLSYIEDLLNKNEKQINKMINSKEKQNEKNIKFYFLGKMYDIITIRTFDKVEIIDDKIYTPSKKELDKWLNINTDNIYLERYNYWYKMFEEKIPYFKLKKRNMKTRWGVCNRKSNTITLNTNLIKYDIECLDYVIIHELSHLIEFNHSNSFWKLVEKYCKNYKKIKRKLKE